MKANKPKQREPMTRCDNCGKQVRLSELEKSLSQTDDLSDRLTPGEEVPAGECECGALAYLVKGRQS